MNGQYEQKFPQSRAMYLYMMVHPGKKLNFMGNEIGQLREWDEKREQDWDMRKYPSHDSFYHYMAELNHIYLEHPALSEWDFLEEGFQWLDCRQESRCLYALQRTSEQEQLIAIFNFSSQTQREYTLPFPEGKAVQLLYSDWERFGGSTRETHEVCWINKNSLICTLEPFSALLLEIESQVFPA